MNEFFGWHIGLVAGTSFVIVPLLLACVLLRLLVWALPSPSYLRNEMENIEPTTFEQISESLRECSDYKLLATLLPVPWEALEGMLSGPCEEYDVDGLGKARGWCFRTNTGVQFFIEQLLDHPVPRYSFGLYARGEDTSANLKTILSATKLDESQLSWVNLPN